MNLTKPPKPIPVEAARKDGLIHLAPAGRRRDLLQGRLQTFCGQVARHALPGLATTQDGFRCPVCYSRIDDYGYLRDL